MRTSLFLFGLFLAAFFLITQADTDSRKFKVDMKSDQLSISADARDKDGVVDARNKLDVDVKLSDGILFRLDLDAKNEVKTHDDSDDSEEDGDGNNVNSKYKIQFTFELDSLVEYSEKNSPGTGYQNTSQLLQTYANPGWKSFQQLPDTTVNNILIKSFQATTKDDVLTIRVYFAEQTVTLQADKFTLNPNSVKFDFEIKNYVYHSASEDARLAFVGRVKSKSKSHISGGGKVEFGDVDAQVLGIFSWVATVSGSDTVSRVVSSDLIEETGDDKRITFSFPDAKSTVWLWDPEYGMEENSGASLKSWLAW